MNTLLRFLRDQRGTETVEWSIIIGIIAVGAIAAAATIGTFVLTSFTGLAAAVAP